MTEPIKSIDQFARSAGAWIGLGGAIFGVLSFFMLLGMWYGPLKELPAQYDMIIGKLTLMDTRINKSDWDIDSVKGRIKELSDDNLSEHTRIWAEVLKYSSLAKDIDVLGTRSAFLDEQVKFMAIDDRAQWDAIRQMEKARTGK